MKSNILLSILFLSVFACEKKDNSGLDSINFEFSFSTETRPIAIAIGKDNGFVFVINHNPSINNFSSKIQKFNLNGDLVNTIVDFESFVNGKYRRYTPKDMSLNSSNIFVLTRPLQLSDDTWISSSGFCVLQFNLKGDLINEYDFSDSEELYYNSIACSNDFIYVTGGYILIKRIEKNSGSASDIHIPITNDKPYLLVSDMEIESDEIIYTTGQGISGIDSINNDVSGCHITKLNCTNEQQITFYSKSRTGVMAAMPNNPGMTISDNGNIYLTTFYGLSIEIYDRDNEFILQEDINPDARPETLPIDIALINNDIYILDYKNSKVLVYNEERK